MRFTLGYAALFIVSSFSARAQTPNLPFVQQVRAYVTGYNTLPEQTSPTPCIAASGGNICGRTDVVACPRRSASARSCRSAARLICEDRLAKKYDSRFDISCDKDFACPYQVTGWADDQSLRREPAGGERARRDRHAGAAQNGDAGAAHRRAAPAACFTARKPPRTPLM